MADVAIEVLIDAHPGGYEIGDFVCAYPAAQMGSRSGNTYTPFGGVMPRTGLIFIIDVPDVFVDPIEEVVKRSLCRRVQGGAKRQFQVNFNAIPTGPRNQFLADRHDTFNWGQVKGWSNNKIGGIPIIDGDLG